MRCLKMRIKKWGTWVKGTPGSRAWSLSSCIKLIHLMISHCLGDQCYILSKYRGQHGFSALGRRALRLRMGAAAPRISILAQSTSRLANPHAQPPVLLWPRASCGALALHVAEKPNAIGACFAYFLKSFDLRPGLNKLFPAHDCS